LKAEAVAYLGGQCLDCGLIDDCVPVYDFHHIDSDDKDTIITRLICRMAMRKAEPNFNDLRPELDKCELLCATCHRRRHHKDKAALFAPSDDITD